MDVLRELPRLVHRLIRAVRWRMARRRLFAQRPDSFTLHGVALELGPWATDPIRVEVYTERYELPEREVVLATLRPDDVVLEIGAGMGYITTIAAGIAREARSFDANPELAQVASATVARNGRRVQVQNGVLARSPGAGTVPFYIAEDFWGSSLTPVDGGRRVDVPVLDFAQACDGCTYLIVDIEGAEVDLLRGDLPGIRAICVECHPGLVSAHQITGMLASLFAQGFMLDLATSRGQVLYLARG